MAKTISKERSVGSSYLRVIHSDKDQSLSFTADEKETRNSVSLCFAGTKRQTGEKIHKLCIKQDSFTHALGWKETANFKILMPEDFLGELAEYLLENDIIKKKKFINLILGGKNNDKTIEEPPPHG